MIVGISLSTENDAFQGCEFIEAATVQAAINKLLKMHKPNTIMVVGVFEGVLDNLLD